jgi:glycosyltransferase involved in cell wall biosynthesis
VPTISVLTPTWNRAAYLERVWSGLAAQTSTDFEWIVADDGSTDDTEAVVCALAARARFPILYLRAAAHVGKARIDNEAIARARGEFALWCDSDDVLVPQAVARLLEGWYSIPEHERSHYVGVTAFAATSEGVIANPFGASGDFDLSWNELAHRFKAASDMVYMARMEALRAHPFPEVDLVIPESVVWNAIGHRKARLIPEILKRVEYRAPYAISFSGKMSYNRGRAHALAITERELRPPRRERRASTARLVNFLRYSLHGEIGFSEARALWGDNSSSIRFWLAVPWAALRAAIDRARGKVVRSHREFLVNRGSPVSAIWLSDTSG